MPDVLEGCDRNKLLIAISFFERLHLKPIIALLFLWILCSAPKRCTCICGSRMFSVLRELWRKCQICVHYCAPHSSSVYYSYLRKRDRTVSQLILLWWFCKQKVMSDALHTVFFAVHCCYTFCSRLTWHSLLLHGFVKVYLDYSEIEF